MKKVVGNWKTFSRKTIHSWKIFVKENVYHVRVQRPVIQIRRVTVRKTILDTKYPALLVRIEILLECMREKPQEMPKLGVKNI